MRTAALAAAASLGALVLALVLTWVFQGNDFFVYKVFAPRQEAVRRSVFEKTRSFNQGMVQELENMQFKYLETSDAEARAALADVILHRASGYDMSDDSVSPSLRSFVQKLKDDRTRSNKRSFE